MIFGTWCERASIAALAFGLSAGLSASVMAQVEHVLPQERGKESDLDAQARKSVKPAERNLEVLPPELSDPGPAQEGDQPEPSVQRR